MIDFDSAVVLTSITSATVSLVALLAALYAKAQGRRTVQVSIDGKAFEVEGVDPAEIQAALARLEKAKRNGRVPVETA